MKTNSVVFQKLIRDHEEARNSRPPVDAQWTRRVQMYEANVRAVKQFLETAAVKFMVGGLQANEAFVKAEQLLDEQVDRYGPLEPIFKTWGKENR